MEITGKLYDHGVDDTLFESLLNEIKNKKLKMNFGNKEYDVISLRREKDAVFITANVNDDIMQQLMDRDPFKDTPIS